MRIGSMTFRPDCTISHYRLWKLWCFRPLLCTWFRLNWAKQTPGIMRRMTKLAPEWVRTSDPVIRSPARYRWTTAPASLQIMGFGPDCTISYYRLWGLVCITHYHITCKCADEAVVQWNHIWKPMSSLPSQGWWCYNCVSLAGDAIIVLVWLVML